MDMADDDGGRLADESFSPTDDTDDTDLSRLTTPLRGMDSSFVDGFFFCARIERRISGWNIIHLGGNK